MYSRIIARIRSFHRLIHMAHGRKRCLIGNTSLLHIRLQDDLTHNELADACLEITDEKGEPVETWMTRVDNGYTIRGLSVDKCYTITEKLPREGYLVKFTAC